MTRTQPIPSERGDIVLVEYDGDSNPVRVVTRDNDGSYLTDWNLIESEHDGETYIEENGGSCRNEVQLSGWASTKTTWPIWYADGIALTRFLHHEKKGDEIVGCIYGPVETAEHLAALGMHRIDEPLSLDPFADARSMDGDDLEWCQFCGPMLSDAENLCRHIFFHEGLEGPGADDYREPYTVPVGFKRLVRRLGCARHLLRHLTAGKFPSLSTWGPMLGPSYVEMTLDGRRFDEAFNRISSDPGDHEGDYQQGFLWMSSMDEHTTGFNGAVVAWLREEIAAQRQRRASGEATYSVRSGRSWQNMLHQKDMTYAEAKAYVVGTRAAGNRDAWIVRRVPKAAARAA